MEDFALPYESEFAAVPVKDLKCQFCETVSTPEKQFRLRPDECGQKTPTSGWVCPNCEEFNFTPDDDSILDEEILES